MEGQNSAGNGEKSETVLNALTAIKELAEKYENTADSKEIIKLNLVEFPQMIEKIKAVDAENSVRREKGEIEFNLKETPEYKRMKKHGLDFYGDIEHQEQIEKSQQGYAEVK